MNRLINVIVLLAIAWLAFNAGKSSRKMQPVTVKKIVTKIDELHEARLDADYYQGYEAELED